MMTSKRRSLVFQRRKSRKPFRYLGVGKPRPVDVLGVVIEDVTLPQALFEDARHLALADDGNLRVAPGRVEDQHLFHGVCRRDVLRAEASPAPNATIRIRGWRPEARRLARAASEVDLRGEPEKSRRQDRQRLQPRPAGNLRVVVGQDRAGVERVVYVEGDPRARAGPTSASCPREHRTG